MSLFDSEFLKRLEYLSLVSRRAFRGQLLAQRRTKQLGGGVEFSDHRQYSSGDDLRYLDWNAYARHREMLLKRFQEEQDLHVYLLVDVSPSMHHDANKFNDARRVAAALGYIALADMDRVSVLAYAEDLTDVLPLMRGKERVLTLFRFLEQLEATGTTTQLQEAAKSFVHQAQKPGLALIVSDLYDQEGFRQGVDVLRYYQFEPHLIQIYTPEEANPSVLGDVEVRDVESGRQRQLTVSQRDLSQYRHRFQTFLDSVEGYCRRYAINYTRGNTDVPFDDLILGMMRSAKLTS